MNRIVAAAALLLTLSLAAPGALKAEVYAGPFAMAIVLDQTRTVNNTKLVDLGGDAFGGGIRAGWGTALSSGIYLGVEGEAFALTGRSRAVVNGVAYSYSLRGGAAAYARAGWRSPGGALLFVRGGAVSFDTNDGWQTMPAVGVGMEVPLTSRWSARLDGTYAWNDIEHYGIALGAVYRW
jgi:hypothetical protein